MIVGPPPPSTPRHKKYPTKGPTAPPRESPQYLPRSGRRPPRLSLWKGQPPRSRPHDGSSRPGPRRRRGRSSLSGPLGVLGDLPCHAGGVTRGGAEQRVSRGRARCVQTSREDPWALGTSCPRHPARGPRALCGSPRPLLRPRRPASAGRAWAAEGSEHVSCLVSALESKWGSWAHRAPRAWAPGPSRPLRGCCRRGERPASGSVDGEAPGRDGTRRPFGGSGRAFRHPPHDAPWEQRGPGWPRAAALCGRLDPAAVP